jgi:hypothetical protein
MPVPGKVYRQCEHCGSPRKGVQCRHWWYSPYAKEARKAGIDPPCALDDYDEGQRELARSDRRTTIITFVIVFAAIAALVWAAY